jgi:hypothetical protein
VGYPKENEKHEGQTNSPGQPFDHSIAFTAVPNEENQGRTQAVDDSDQKYDDQDFYGHDKLVFG